MFRAFGLDPKDDKVAKAIDSFKGHWKARFFGNDFIGKDEASDAALARVHELYNLGAHIVYLTGRNEPNMGSGTRAKLKSDGLPLGDRATLIMKPNAGMDDSEFKKEAASQVRSFGPVIAAVDNEPGNVAVFVSEFPYATHVFMDTGFSPKEAPLVSGVYIVNGWQ